MLVLMRTDVMFVFVLYFLRTVTCFCPGSCRNDSRIFADSNLDLVELVVSYKGVIMSQNLSTVKVNMDILRFLFSLEN